MSSRPRTYSRSRQRGAFMLEMSLALAISAIAAVGSLRTIVNAGRMQTADIQADVVRTYRHALQTYTEENYIALQAGTPVIKNGITLVAGAALGQIYQPDIPNLIAMGYLPIGFANNVMLVDGAGFRNEIQLQPLGCLPTACNVRGLAYIDQPITVRGSGAETDGTIIGQMLARIGGDAGTSVEGSTAVITAAGGGWTWPNPVPGAPAGVMATRFGYDASALGNFVRLNDLRDPTLQGNLSAVGNLSIGGTSTLNGALTVNAATTLNGNTTVNGNSTVVDGAGVTCVNMDRTGVVTISCAGTLNARSGVFTDGLGNTTTINQNGVVATGRVTGTQGLSTASGTVFDATDPNAIVVTGTQMFIRGSSGTMMALDNGDVVATKNVAGMRMAVSEFVVEGAACANTSGAVAGAVTEFAGLVGGGMATCAAGRWTAVSRAGTAGVACTMSGAYATDQTDGQGLICRNGIYVRTAALLSNFVLASTMSASDGTVLAKPVCPDTGGAPPQPLIILVPANEDPSVVAPATVSGINRFAVDNGTDWTAHLQRSVDGASLPGTMIANMYCWYP